MLCVTDQVLSDDARSRMLYFLSADTIRQLIEVFIKEINYEVGQGMKIRNESFPVDLNDPSSLVKV